MIVERIEEIRLSRRDDAQVGTLLDLCFDTDFSGRSFYQQRPHVRFISRDCETIVGNVSVFYRDIRMGDELVVIAGLGDVATHPDARGQGIASKLLEAAISEAKQSLAAFFILFGDRPLYGAAGFVQKENDVRYVNFQGARTGKITEEAADFLMVLPLADRLWNESILIDLVGQSF